jgi:hypothetical protein
MRLFAELVHRRSGGGNPFFAGQFLASLAEERLIRFDPLSRSWTWDLDAIVDKRFSDNPVDLMIGRLRRLAPEAQEALKLLACLGSHADFATLAKLRTESDEATRSKNWRSMLKSTWFQPLIEPTAPLFELRGIRRRILNAGGKHRGALTLIVDAIDVQQRGGKLLYMPALFRMKGLILASRSGEDHFEAEESLLLAIDWAKRQHASLFELKAATDLAGLLHTQGRVSEAYQHLSAAFDRSPAEIVSPLTSEPCKSSTICNQASGRSAKAYTFDGRALPAQSSSAGAVDASQACLPCAVRFREQKSGMITVHVNKRHRVIKVYDHGGAGANVSPQQLGEPPIVPHLVHIRHFSVVEAGTDPAGFARWCDSLSDHGGVR